MRVLLIEDDRTTAQSIELMLTSETFNLYTTDLLDMPCHRVWGCIHKRWSRARQPAHADAGGATHQARVNGAG
jgi:hypothetical protein